MKKVWIEGKMSASKDFIVPLTLCCDSVLEEIS